MQVVRTFYSPEEAYTAVSLLSAHGLHAHLLDDATLSVMPLDSVALGGYRVAVLPHEITKALSLLENPEVGSQDQGSPQYFGDEYEVSTASDQPAQPSSKSRPYLFLFSAIMILIIGLYWQAPYW